jgi:WD40 repeat protein
MRLRLFPFAILVVTTGLLVGCKPKPTTDDKAATPPDGQGPGSTDVGAPLFPLEKAPTYPAVYTRNEPLIISNALAQFEERQTVPAEVDGTVDVVATEILLGEKVDPSLIVYMRQDPQRTKPMRRIIEGEEVKYGQLLAVFDAQQITAKLEGAKKIKESAETALKAAGQGKDAAYKRLLITKEAVLKGGAAPKDELDDQLTYQRFVENEAQAAQTIARADQDAAEAKVLEARHYVRSRVNGFIRTIARRPGEFAKAGDKLMEIEATDRVRIEGQLDVQYAAVVEEIRRKRTDVTVEPAVPSAPSASPPSGHRQAVTGIAVVSVVHGDQTIPLVVSTGADGSALVWDPNLGKRNDRPTVPHNLPHPVGVRSIAATPATAKAALVITGADDGKIRIWNVSNPARLPDKPQAEPEETHTSAIHSIAISPNGQYFASAAGRDVFIWELATAKKRYVLPAEHRDNVTGVTFTPQNTLITTSKDGSLKVWKLGADKAAVIRTLDHRAGAVEVLGVSHDGARVLFDQDKGRIDLVDPANGQTVGQLQNVSSAGSFSTVALFGQHDVPFGAPADAPPLYGIVTVGGDGDLKGTVQYWHAPRAGGRGAEVARLITPGRAQVTAVAFSPIRSEPFLVVGTSAGGVHLWKPPSEARKTHTGKITLIDSTDTRYVTVRVEMSNKEAKLLDKSAVTIIIPTNP